MSLITICACAIMVIMAKEGGCHKGMWTEDEKLVYTTNSQGMVTPIHTALPAKTGVKKF